jgi:hypothetical protein
VRREAMGWPKNNPELYNQLITNRLPEPWHSGVENGDIELDHVPERLRFEAARQADEDYWADRIDSAMMRKKE